MKVGDYSESRVLISEKDLQRIAKQQISELVRHQISDGLEAEVREHVKAWMKKNRKRFAQEVSTMLNDMRDELVSRAIRKVRSSIKIELDR